MDHASDLPLWDLSGLYASPSDPAIESSLAEARVDATRFAVQYQGRVGGLDPDALAALLRAYETLLAAMYRPQMYANLLSSTHSADEEVRALHARVNEVGTELSNLVRFVDTEIARCPAEVAQAWLDAPAMAGFRHHLQRTRAAAPHTLAGDVENALATKNLTARRAWSQLYNELTAAWRFDVEVDGRVESLHLAGVRSLRESPDRGVRERATVAMQQQFERDALVLSTIVNTTYQDHRLENELRGYDTPVAPTLLDDELDRATLDALMTAVESHYPVMQEYLRLKAKALDLPRLENWDVLAPYPDGDRDVAWADARDVVLAAFGDLDADIAARAKGFFDERRIDAAPRAGKRDGAFCAGMVPGTAPRVLVNFHGRQRDVFTLAHELGHGVHFSLAGERQSLLNYWPTSPMAETASVFGEMVLTRKLLSSETDPARRRVLLASRIEEAMGTIHRQVAFTRYEMNAHDRRAKGVVPATELCALWGAELDHLYGDSVARGPRDGWGWAGIPHLIHYRFYCYSYAFGQLLVFALYRLWEQDGAAFVPRYRALLEGGGSDTPHALLARVGIDITDPAFWRRGLEVVTAMVEEFRADV